MFHQIKYFPCFPFSPIIPLAFCPICWPLISFMICYMRNEHVSAFNSLYVITDESVHIFIEHHQPPCCSCCITDKVANKKFSMDR